MVHKCLWSISVGRQKCPTLPKTQVEVNSGVNVSCFRPKWQTYTQTQTQTVPTKEGERERDDQYKNTMKNEDSP